MMSKQAAVIKKRPALGAAGALAQTLKAFLSAEKIRLDVTGPKDATVRVIEAGRLALCGAKTLRAGGRITCPVALAMAPALGITPRQMGKLMDFLKIKIRHCKLGCF